MEGEMTPAMGPTAAWWWQGSRRTSPRSTRAIASASVWARPSNSRAPVTAPRSGPEARSQAMGGPAWRRRSSVRPGTRSPARAMPVSIGRAEVMRSTAIWLALSMSMTLHARENSSKFLVPPGWGLPLHLHGRGSLGEQAIVERLQSDVDGGEGSLDGFRGNRNSRRAARLSQPNGFDGFGDGANDVGSGAAEGSDLLNKILRIFIRANHDDKDVQTP